MNFARDSKIGLGLFVSKQIISKNGGSINFISKTEKGSIFIFTFKVKITDQTEENQFDHMWDSAFTNLSGEEN